MLTYITLAGLIVLSNVVFWLYRINKNLQNKIEDLEHYNQSKEEFLTEVTNDICRLNDEVIDVYNRTSYIFGIIKNKLNLEEDLEEKQKFTN